jgi:hypothetical protein
MLEPKKHQEGDLVPSMGLWPNQAKAGRVWG